MSTIQTLGYPRLRKITRYLGFTWNWLTEPAATITEPEQRRQAQLLASLLISLMLLNILSSVVQLLIVPGFVSTFTVLVRTLIVLAIAYGLSRTSHYKLGALITVAIPSIAVFFNLLSNPDDVITLAFISIGILICSIFFSIRTTALLAAANILVVLLLVMAIPELVMPGTIVGPLSFIIIMSALILVAAHHRDKIEEDRQVILAEREERFRQAFNNAPIGMALLSLDHKFMQVNQALCNILGYCEAELVALDVASITHPDDFGSEKQIEGWLIDDSRQSYATEKRYIHANGHTVWGQLSISLVTDSRGAPLYSIGQLEDITDRKWAEEEVLTRTRQQAAVAKLGQLALDESGDLESLMDEANATVAKTLDVEYSKILELLPGGENFILRSSAGLEKELNGQFTVEDISNLQAGYTLQANEPIIVKDFQTETRFRGSPLVQNLGIRSGISVIIHCRPQPYGVLCAHTTNHRTFSEDDINFLQAVANIMAEAVERKDAKEALKQSEAYFRSLIENGLDIITVINGDGTIRYLSPSVKHVLGYEVDAFLGQDAFSKIFPDDLSTLTELFAQVSKESGPISPIEFRIWHKDGSIYTLEANANNLLDDPVVEGIVINARDISKRKDAERALQTSEYRFRRLVEQSPFSIIIYTPDGRPLIANRAAGDLWNLSPEGLAYLVDTYNIFEDQEVRNQGLLPYVEKGFAGEFTRIPAVEFDRNLDSESTAGNGTSQWVQGYIYPIKDQKGNVNEVVLMHEDISERKQAEEALKASEQNYRELYAAAQRQALELTLLDRVRTALAPEVELDVILSTVVEAIADEFGYTLVSLYLLEANNLVLQHQVGYGSVIRSIPISLGVMGEVIRTGQSILLEDAHAHPGFIEAIEGIVSEVSVPLFDRGQIVGILNVESAKEMKLGQRDLHLMEALAEYINLAIERAHLYTEVSESERRFRVLIENSPTTMSLLDRQGNILYTSPATTRILGYEVDEFIGLQSETLVHSDDVGHRSARLARLMSDPKTPVSYQIRVRHKNGTWRWVDVVAANLLAEPSVQAIVANFHDVTDRRKAEETLQHTQKLDSLGVMSGGVAHDFNNLLTAILGNASLAQMELPAGSPAHTDLGKVVQAAERATHLTQQLLAYSGQGQFEVGPLELNQIIEGNLHLFQVAIPKNVIVKTSLTKPLPSITADAGQMQQLVMNLVINASEAMEGRPGTITVATDVQQLEADLPGSALFTGDILPVGRYVTLSIRDNGSGMDEETLGRIFDPFFTTKSTGSGLGLAAVLGIVRGHHGGLQVESTVGKGTTFSLLFPTTDDAPTRRQIPGELIGPDTSTGLVLVVDDEEPVREVIIRTLRRNDVRVIGAPDGTTGLELYRERQAELGLVFLDLSMPGMSGEETCVAMRKVNPNIPIILTSGYAETELSASFEELGVVDFLQKPYRSQKLLEMVGTYLE